MSKLQRDQAGNLFPAIVGKLGATQIIAAGSTSSQSTAFGQETTLIRVAVSTHTGTDAHVHFAIGSNPTATTTGSPMFPCGTVEYVLVAPGDKIAFIRGGGADIDVSITEITNA